MVIVNICEIVLTISEGQDQNLWLYYGDVCVSVYIFLFVCFCLFVWIGYLLETNS